MNYFFGINNSEFSSELQIPLFQNRNKKPSNLLLYEATIYNNEWKIKQIDNRQINKDFYLLNSKDITNSNIFFLASPKDLEVKKNKLENFNKFTETSPAYRANLKIVLKNGGFSSYQSEYPFSMIEKKGSILSSVCSLANRNADKNYIFIKNIFVDPIIESFDIYLVDIIKKKIEEQFEINTNYTNCFELKKSLIKPEIFLVSKNYIGIPMYVSVKNNHVSFEHTHPPHEYILSNNKFKKISDLKKEINEIVN
jgi:hypothetical protein